MEIPLSRTTFLGLTVCEASVACARLHRATVFLATTIGLFEKSRKHLKGWGYRSTLFVSRNHALGAPCT